MTTTVKKHTKEETVFTPSVNIIRDTDTELNYIPTPNSKQIFNQLVNDYKTGIRSFNIVGAYGTGKSSFLWAFERNINHKRYYFSGSKIFQDIKEFEVMSFVGESASFSQTFAYKIGAKFKKDFTTGEIIRLLNKYYKPLHKAKKGLLIVADEFGKFLEYAAKNNPENELYFIQLLAEYVNDHRQNILLITTLHQDFNGYARGLTRTQQNEWDKIKGRLKEITFNEPVEQLLYLASERLNELDIETKAPDFKKLFRCIEAAKAFPLKDYFNEEVAEKLLPFDILSAAVLTLALQKYGQNERSLFSFIEANDMLGIRDFTPKKAPYYNLSCVYDYLIHNYYSFLTTKYNPHYTQWTAIRSAIERTEGMFDEDVEGALELLKSIGLMNIFASTSVRLDTTFLCDYGKYSLGIKEPEKIIKALEGLKIIRYVNYSDKYILFEGTDLDIELAIDEAGRLVEKVTNFVHHLNVYFDFPCIPAKAAFYERGTPRFFAFHLSETPEALTPEGEIDGYINFIFSDKIKEKEIKEASAKCEEAVLYGWYKNTDDIGTLIYEIEKIKKVKENYSDDKVAVRELDGILQHQIKLLNHFVMGEIYAKNSPVVWYFKGKKEHVVSQKSFNRLLSQICDAVYPATPVFKNEMVNKTKISGAIATAKKNFLKAMMEKWSEQYLGFDEEKFPPEKTIYLSLLHETRMHRKGNEGFVLGEPINDYYKFSPLWKACESFLNSTRQGKRNLQELTDKLYSKPLKLKKGFVDFWLPVFLFIKRDDFAVFSEDGYIPFLTDETLDLISHQPGDYEIKAFDIEGVKLNLFNRYRALLNQKEKSKPTADSFIETIRPFLTFYRDLPGYAKQTKRLDNRTQALRHAIAYSKDPEETFFEHFPKSLGYNMVQLQKSEHELETFANQLQSSIRELRGCYDALLTRVEDFLTEEIIGAKTSFPAYKIAMQNRFATLKNHLLLPVQKVFYQRVMSELDDRMAWLNSIAQACIGKSLDVIADEDEETLYEKLKDRAHELDNLCELSKAYINDEMEDVFKLEITSFVDGIKKNLVRLPKSKSREVNHIASELQGLLGNDKRVKVAVLLKLLQQELKDEE